MAGVVSVQQRTTGHSNTLHRDSPTDSSQPDQAEPKEDEVEKEPTNIELLDDMLDDFNVNEAGVIGLLGKLSPVEKSVVLAGTSYRNKMAGAFNVDEMVLAVNALGPDLATKLEWIKAAEGTGYDYEKIKPLIVAAPLAQRSALKTDTWKEFFVGVCTNDTMPEAVDDLGFDLETKLRWMLAEGASLENIRKAVDAAPVAEVEAVQQDPALYALVTDETGDSDVVAERLAREVLAYIQAQAAAKAAVPRSIDPASNFYKALKDKYLKDYLAAPSVAEGEDAVQGIGRSMETRRSPTDPAIIEVKPEAGMWRPAEGRWEEGAELFWNKQKLPTLPPELMDLPMFKNIKILPTETAAATDMLIKENLTALPYPDVPFLLGVPNTSTATLTADVVKGGKNLSQLMHWATGVKYSKESPEGMRELFLAYEKWHLEGWDVFGQDALNDLIAEEQGRLLGAELQKGPAGAIKGEADLIPFLNESFLESRAWVGALLRLRKAELDQWILAKEQRMAQMHWGALGEKDLWRGSPTVFQMIASGKTMADVKSSFMVQSQIEIYTLLFEADLWEAANGPIALTDFEKALVAGDIDAILAWSATGATSEGAAAASEQKRKLQGGS